MKFNEFRKITDRINKLYQQAEGKHINRAVQDEIDDLYAMLYPSLQDYYHDDDYFYVDKKTLMLKIANFFKRRKIDCKMSPITSYFKTKTIQLEVGGKSYQIGGYINMDDKCALNLDHMDAELNRLVADYPGIDNALWATVKDKFIEKYGDHTNPEVVLKS